jgi:hypothetical protein
MHTPLQPRHSDVSFPQKWTPQSFCKFGVRGVASYTLQPQALCSCPCYCCCFSYGASSSHCRRAKFCRGEGCGTMLACLQDPVRTARRTKRRGRGPEENGNKPFKDKGGVQQASHSCRQSALRGHDKTMVHGRPPWVSLSAVPRATARRQRTNDRPARLNQSNGR